jgi:hypothetical protein
MLSPLLSACLVLSQQPPDAANITNPTQSDYLIGTRVPRDLAWKSPTPEERWRVFWRGVALSPGAFTRAGLSAAAQQRSNTPFDYGQGAAGYGKRFANNFATFTLQDVAGNALAAAAGYEVRYIQCKCTGFLPRLGHAMLFNLVTYDRRGRKVLNWPNLVGNYAAGIVSTQYTPNSKWSAQGLQAGNNALLFGFGSAVVQEFLPGRLLPRFGHRRKQRTVPPAQAPLPQPLPAASSPKESIQ